MSLTERNAELDRREAENAGVSQDWRRVSERRAAYARARRKRVKRGRRKHRNLRRDYREQEKRLVAAVAGLKSAVLALDAASLPDEDEEARNLETRARNALAFALDAGPPETPEGDDA